MSVNCNFLLEMCPRLRTLDTNTRMFANLGNIPKGECEQTLLALERKVLELDNMAKALQAKDLTQRMVSTMNPAILHVKVKFRGIIREMHKLMGKTLPKNDDIKNFQELPVSLEQLEQHLRSLITTNGQLFREYNQYADEQIRKIDPSKVKELDKVAIAKYKEAETALKGELLSQQRNLGALALAAVANSIDLFKSQKSLLMTKLQTSITQLATLRKQLQETACEIDENAELRKIQIELRNESRFPTLVEDLSTQIKPEEVDDIMAAIESSAAAWSTLGQLNDKLEALNKELNELKNPPEPTEEMPLLPLPVGEAPRQRKCPCIIF